LTCCHIYRRVVVRVRCLYNLSFLIALAAADEDEETSDALKDVVKPNNSSKLR